MTLAGGFGLKLGIITPADGLRTKNIIKAAIMATMAIDATETDQV